MLSNMVIFATTVIAIAYLYSPSPRISGSDTFRNSKSGSGLSQESQIVQAWGDVIDAGLASSGFIHKSKIAVGVNADADLIVSGADVLRKLGIAPSGQALDNAEIKSLSDLEETFSFSFKNGAAIERIFSRNEDFETVVNAADSLDEKQYFVGGNAALAGLQMATTWKELQVLLIGPCGPKVRALLPDNMVIPETSVMVTDEVHLIMEFKREERWGDDTAKVATRFITSYDVSNTEMTALSQFSESVKAFSPDAVFFSGLHLLDGKPDGKIGEKIEALRAQLNQLPSDLPIHLELASMADPNLIKRIYEEVLPMFHSLGLNEQELSFMSAVNSGPHPELYIREGYPEVGAVADILYWILATMGQGAPPPEGTRANSGQSSKLSRVHFHSLAFHIVATVQDAWTNNAAAVSAGARIAGRQACDDGKIVDDKVELRVPNAFALSINHAPLRQRIVRINPREPVVTWTRGNIEFHFTPVLVCKNPVKTVGLGDAISSTGFLYSQFAPHS